VYRDFFFQVEFLALEVNYRLFLQITNVKFQKGHTGQSPHPDGVETSQCLLLFLLLCCPLVLISLKLEKTLKVWVYGIIRDRKDV
jgi:hypothetical protein